MSAKSASTTQRKPFDLVAVSLAVRHIYESAQGLRESHTLSGVFPPYEAECKAEYDRLVSLAASINDSLPPELQQDPLEFQIGDVETSAPAPRA